MRAGHLPILTALARLPTVPTLVALVLVLAGCGSGLPAQGGRLRVVAAENVWGSIARQLGGTRASVTSIIASAAQDPHSYEPTTTDARTMATAQLAIVNGVGYDPWAPKLLAASPVDGRVTLTVGSVLHLHDGDNPHRWYSPTDVATVAAAITRDLVRLDPRHRAYYAGRLRAFTTAGLDAYHRLIAEIRRRYTGVPVGASESIFALQAPALGLRLLTPTGFTTAISEGSEPTAQEIVAAERQVSAGAVRVWVVNTQNVTPEITRLDAIARARHIPIATVTETLSPASNTFQQWQVAQLQDLRAALHRATGR